MYNDYIGCITRGMCWRMSIKLGLDLKPIVFRVRERSKTKGTSDGALKVKHRTFSRTAECCLSHLWAVCAATNT